jgi:hypothetical protein
MKNLKLKIKSGNALSSNFQLLISITTFKTLLSFSLFIVSFSLFISSCSKEGATGATGATGASGTPGPSLTGSITGHIVLYDEYGGQQFGNESAAKVYVYVDGTTTAVDLVNADSAGVYTISNVQTGTYIMTFTCPGYGLMQRNAFGFTGGGVVNYDAKLSQMPDFYRYSYYL